MSLSVVACSSGSSESGSTGTTPVTEAATTVALPVTNPSRTAGTGSVPLSSTTRTSDTGNSPALVDLADTVAAVRSGVVRIRVESCSDRGSGTGMMVSPRHVVTVEHVVDGASRITLERSRNHLGSAEVIGLDRDRDLALLRLKKPISGHRFRFAERAPRLGEEVAALGYPLGLPLSVSRGTVSGLSRTIAIDNLKRRALVQTDAAVNHGNSGGPLLAVKTGEVVGLVDLGSTELNGIAFAVSGVVARALVSAWRAAPQPHPLERCPGRVSAIPADGGRRSVGVPASYEGHFTSVDRLQRCYATDVSVVCTSGPSGKAVELEAGGSVRDRSPLRSRDVGGPSMPMGTAFTTPGDTIRCESSSRGISCRDLTGGGSFTLGDYRLVINSGSGSAGGGSDRGSYAGYFASIDRRERCFMNAEFVACTAAPSGKGVSLSVGAEAVYEGVTGSTDHGGPALGFGERVSSTSGDLNCESSSRGISCSDRSSGNSFVIGDYQVVLRNSGGETRH